MTTKVVDPEETARFLERFLSMPPPGQRPLSEPDVRFSRIRPCNDLRPQDMRDGVAKSPIYCVAAGTTNARRTPCAPPLDRRSYRQQVRIPRVTWGSHFILPTRKPMVSHPVRGYVGPARSLDPLRPPGRNRPLACSRSRSTPPPAGRPGRDGNSGQSPRCDR